MHPQTLHNGTYILQPYARTEAHIRDLAVCGLDRLFGIENHRENPGAEGLFFCACGDPADEHPHTVPVKFRVAAAVSPQ